MVCQFLSKYRTLSRQSEADISDNWNNTILYITLHFNSDKKGNLSWDKFYLELELGSLEASAYRQFCRLGQIQDVIVTVYETYASDKQGVFTPFSIVLARTHDIEQIIAHAGGRILITDFKCELSKSTLWIPLWTNLFWISPQKTIPSLPWKLSKMSKMQRQVHPETSF